MLKEKIEEAIKQIDKELAKGYLAEKTSLSLLLAKQNYIDMLFKLAPQR